MVASFAPSLRHSSIERVACPTFSPRSHRKYSMYSTTCSVCLFGRFGVRNSRSMSLNGASTPRP